MKFVASQNPMMSESIRAGASFVTKERPTGER